MAGVTARACANIALVKYWGKRDAQLNLPAAGSLSLSLAALVTETRVDFDPALGNDLIELEGKPAGDAEARRVTTFLDVVRRRAGLTTRARVTSHNRFPTASGLASSASGFAALAVAATRAAGLELPPQELSILARHGSGSAARSIFGGFVRMHAGDTDEAAYAEPITSSLLDRVRMVIAIVGGGAPKLHTSRDAMDHTAATSPFYAAWLQLVPKDLAAAEANALAMHASAIAARPGVLYWKPATLALIAAVRTLRQNGRAAWATMDAGPHVKVLTTVDDADHVARALANVEGVTATTISGPGGPAYVVG